jgi:AraC-like DNA-binding protein
VLEQLHIDAGAEGELWLYQAAGLVHPAHSHAELELNIVTAGTAHYWLEGRLYELEAGAVVWLYPGQLHRLVVESDDFRMWTAVFSRSLIEQYATQPGSRLLLQSNPPGHYCRSMPPADARALSDLCAAVHADHQQLDVRNAGLAYLLTKSWSLYAGGRPLLGEQRPPAVNAAVRLLQTEPTLPLPELARAVHLSPSYLGHLFRETVGCSITDFRNSVRLDRFLRHCEAGLTLTEASARAGFGSYAQFSRIFTGRFGCSPREYQRVSRG